MSYRDTQESLVAHKARLEDELANAQRAAREATERAKRVTELERALAEVTRMLAEVRAPRALPVVQTVTIAAPCTARWEEMRGDDRVRFCDPCGKNVYNLSSMNEEQASATLSAVKSMGGCVRLYRRADGTVLTEDCPVGVRKRRKRRVIAAVAVGGSVAAALAPRASVQPQASDTRPSTHREPSPSIEPRPLGDPAPGLHDRGQWLGGAVGPPERRQVTKAVPVEHSSACNPPYERDAEGHAHFKPECL